MCVCMTIFVWLSGLQNLAYSEGPSLPNVASVAWLAMSYAEAVDTNTARRLRCWALGQVRYRQMGGGADIASILYFSHHSAN